MIYKLEKRILFDAALPLDIDEASDEMNTQHSEAVTAENQSSVTAANQFEDAATDAGAGSNGQHTASAAHNSFADIPGLDVLAGDLEPPTEPLAKVLLVSSNIQDHDVLADAAQENVGVITYNAQTTDLDELLAMITEQTAGHPIEHLAIATHDLGAAQFHLTGGTVVNLGAVLSDPQQLHFWHELGSMMAPQGRIDLLACNLVSNTEGEILLSQLESVTGCNVAASDDLTGNPGAGGDWVLESDNVDLVPIYFDSTSLSIYRGNLLAQQSKLTAAETSANNLGISLDIDGHTAVVGIHHVTGTPGLFGVYVFEQDPDGTWYRNAKLVPAQVDVDDQFGRSVAIDDQTIIVGAPYYDDGSIFDAGRAYIFMRDGNEWTEYAQLHASDATVGDHFGFDVAIVGDTALVGAPDTDNTDDNTGSIYVFEKASGGWSDMTETEKLVSPTPYKDAVFGFSVALADDEATALIGEPGVNTYETGRAYIFEKDAVAGWSNPHIAQLDPQGLPNEADCGYSVDIVDDVAVVGAPEATFGTYAGAAYIFEKPVTGWEDMSHTTYLYDSNPYDQNKFGWSVGISNDTVIVGSPCPDDLEEGWSYLFEKPAAGWASQPSMTQNDTLSAPASLPLNLFGWAVAIDGSQVLTGAPGHDSDGNPASADYSAAYVFEKASGWGYQSTLFSSGLDNYQFGYSVAIEGDTAVIGTPYGGAWYDGSSTWHYGAAYIFEKTGTSWQQSAKLMPKDRYEGAQFGRSVDICGDVVIIGSPTYDAGGYYGMAYIFEKSPDGWQDMNEETARLTPNDPSTDASFGISVAIEGETAVVGAERAEVGSIPYAGAVYVFEKNGQPDWNNPVKSKLVASDAFMEDFFGHSVAIDGLATTIVVGAPMKDAFSDNAGAVYVFEKPGDTWQDSIEDQQLFLEDGAEDDHFGHSVTIDQDTILIGAPDVDLDATTFDSGEVYVFERVAGIWSDTPIASLKAGDAGANDRFGFSVVLNNNLALVGSPGGGPYDTGVAYLFEKVTTWSDANDQQLAIKANDGVTDDNFGWDVGLYRDPGGEDRAIIGVPMDDGKDGAAYIFVLNNQPPVNTVPLDQTTAEDTSLPFTGANLISVSDPDAGDSDIQVLVTVSHGILNMGDTSELTTLENEGTSSVTMTGNVNAINKALDGMLYTPDPDYSGNDLLTITTNDQGHTGSGGPMQDIDTINLDITPVNDAPLLNDKDIIFYVSEDSGPPVGQMGQLVSDIVDLDIPVGGLDNVHDVDALGGATGMAVVNRDTTHGTWYYSLDNGTTWQVMESVSEDGALLLAADGNTRVYFQPDTNYYGSLDQALTFRAWDLTTGNNGDTGVDTTNNGGSTAFSTATDTVTIDVTAVNDPPINTVPGAQHTDEDTTLVFSSTTGNLISVSDIDAELNDIQVKVEVHNGILTMADISGLSNIENDNTAIVTMTGPVSAINIALDGMQYIPNQDYYGNDVLTITTDDQSHTGIGGAQQDSDTVDITVTSVNDAPILIDSIIDLPNIDEDSPAPNGAVGYAVRDIVDLDNVTVGRDNVHDPDAAGLTGMAVVGADDTNGTWYYTLDNGNTWQAMGPVAEDSAMLLAADNNTRIYFQPIPDYYGTLDPVITFRAWDQTTGSNGQAHVDTTNNGGSTAFSSATDTASLMINPVNDAPINSVPGPQTTTEDTPIFFSSAMSNLITVDDIDAEGKNVMVTLQVNHGWLTVRPSNINIIGNGTDEVILFGSIAAINTAMDGMRYDPELDYYGSDILTITTDDQGHTGIYGNLSDTDDVPITITSLNDAPINHVPGPQQIPPNTPLVFMSANGNQLSVTDADAYNNIVQVSLQVNSGILWLAPSTATVNGDGTNLVTIEGALSEINVALEGLRYEPAAGATSDVLTISTDDQGYTGPPGPLADVDNIPITIKSDDPAIPDGTAGNDQAPSDDVLPTLDNGLPPAENNDTGATGGDSAGSDSSNSGSYTSVNDMLQEDSSQDSGSSNLNNLNAPVFDFNITVGAGSSSGQTDSGSGQSGSGSSDSSSTQSGSGSSAAESTAQADSSSTQSGSDSSTTESTAQAAGSSTQSGSGPSDSSSTQSGSGSSAVASSVSQADSSASQADSSTSQAEPQQKNTSAQQARNSVNSPDHQIRLLPQQHSRSAEGNVPGYGGSQLVLPEGILPFQDESGEQNHSSHGRGHIATPEVAASDEGDSTSLNERDNYDEQPLDYLELIDYLDLLKKQLITGQWYPDPNELVDPIGPLQPADLMSQMPFSTPGATAQDTSDLNVQSLQTKDPVGPLQPVDLMASIDLNPAEAPNSDGDDSQATENGDGYSGHAAPSPARPTGLSGPSSEHPSAGSGGDSGTQSPGTEHQPREPQHSGSSESEHSAAPSQESQPADSDSQDSQQSEKSTQAPRHPIFPWQTADIEELYSGHTLEKMAQRHPAFQSELDKLLVTMLT